MDALGALHHVIARGIERREIFRDKSDYQDYLSRLEVIIDECGVLVVCLGLDSKPFSSFSNFDVIALRAEVLKWTY
ncbi:hypothetical protein KJ693_03950 [bacterium]|nr:hypothetical protein [bacterium]MBU1614447.1 hypothetical protein [bacterium]